MNLVTLLRVAVEKSSGKFQKSVPGGLEVEYKYTKSKHNNTRIFFGKLAKF